MKARWSVAVFACCLFLLAFTGFYPASQGGSGEEEAVRAVNQSWFKSYAGGDAKGVASLYADDAVVNPPGVPAVRGQDAILEYLTKDIAAAGGTNMTPDPNTEVKVSGDMAFEWGAFTVTDKSGSALDKGKFLTTFAKRDGKWVIVNDMWNSDAPMQTGKQ
jgi:uncharacterized protein (TIGR02246 family)